MNTPLIKPGQLWIFRGEDGRGLKHRVTEVSADGVTTWSEAYADNTPMLKEGIAGFFWFGPVTDFLQQFQPTTT